MFPTALAPPPPFPLVVSQAAAPEFVAPGVERADYRLVTSDGPLVVHVVAVDAQEPSVRIRVVLARDHLLSAGETVSSMAVRTGAVAGVNGDYFDIGQTNQPLNVVVNDGLLVRTPSKRAAFAIDRDGRIGFGTFAFSGSAAFDGTEVPLTAVNEWPPQGGASLLTPAFGMMPETPEATVATLEPLDTTVGAPGTYRVAAVGPPRPGPVRATLLGFGPAVRQRTAPPQVNDTVDLEFASQPSFANLAAAIGGGPLLVSGGAPADDPNAPAPEERDVRFPVSGAAVTADGTLLLFAVDGRQPTVSIGLTRPQFGALMRGFGATDGMAFDSGGSATLVARVLGDDAPTVLNAPSDGRQRLVADGLFVYSDAPRGHDPHLFVRPATFAALPDAVVALSGVVVDDAGHPLRAAELAPLRVDPAPGPHVATVSAAGGLRAEIAYRTVERAAALQLVPDRPNPAPLAAVALHVAAADAQGAPIVLGHQVSWSAAGGTISGDGSSATFRAGSTDGSVTVSAGGATLTVPVRVGSHLVALPSPAGRPELEIAYDFTGAARSADARFRLPLPGDPLAFGAEVEGDGNGAVLRASFVNRFGEPVRLTLAPHVNWHGWRRVTVALPPTLNPPVTLTSIYLLPALGGPPIHVAGTIRVRNPAAVIRGSR